MKANRRGFTLLEVMMAMAIFFMAIFAILELVSRGLREARSLQQTQINANGLLAVLSLTNRLEEGSASGDFGDEYPGATWTRTITEVGTNGLFEVDYLVQWNQGGHPLQHRTSALLWRPDSVNQAGGGFRR